MSTLPKPYITLEEYLEIDRNADIRCEYYQGVMYAMAGARESHNLVVTNAVSELRQQLRSRPCRVYPSDMRVHVSSTGLYAFPDATVVCGKPQFTDGQRDTLLNPEVIIEVLSPSTEAYDRGAKFQLYRSIESFREYVLISSGHIHVDLFRRQADGLWVMTEASGVEDTIELKAIDCRLKLADLYEKVEFVAAAPGPHPVIRS